MGRGVRRWLAHVVDKTDPATAWRFRAQREKDQAPPVLPKRTAKAKATQKARAKNKTKAQR